MRPIQLAFHYFTVLRMFISPLIHFNNYSFSTRLVQLIFFIPFHKGDGWHFLGSCNLAVVIISGSVVCTLVQALRPCTGRTAHRWNRDIALHFRDHGFRSRWGVSVTSRPLFAPGKNTVRIVQEVGWVTVPVWTGAENLVPTGIQSPDHPARSQSLYRLRYPVHSLLLIMS